MGARISARDGVKTMNEAGLVAAKRLDHAPSTPAVLGLPHFQIVE